MATEQKKRYEIRQGLRCKRKLLTKDEVTELTREGAQCTPVEDLGRAKMVADYQERIMKGLGNGRFKARGPEWRHGKKWSCHKTGQGSGSKYVEMHQLGSDGKVLKFRFPRENWQGVQ